MLISVSRKKILLINYSDSDSDVTYYGLFPLFPRFLKSTVYFEVEHTQFKFGSFSQVSPRVDNVIQMMITVVCDKTNLISRLALEQSIV